MNIKFSHNWNDKLNHKIFTTIRKSNSNKFQYYFKNIGSRYDVILNNKTISNAVLLNVEKQKYIDLPKGLLYQDTGIDSIDLINDVFFKFNIRPNDEVIILTFKNE